MNLCSGIFGKTETLADEETDKIIAEYAKKASEVIISWGNLTRNDLKEREVKVLKVLKTAKKRVLAVSDGNGKENVHILTPSVRNSFSLVEVNIKEMLAHTEKKAEKTENSKNIDIPE